MRSMDIVKMSIGETSRTGEMPARIVTLYSSIVRRVVKVNQSQCNAIVSFEQCVSSTDLKCITLKVSCVRNDPQAARVNDKAPRER